MEDFGARLYEEYKSGDDEAVGKLVDLYFDGLTLFINGIIGDLDASQDVAQEVFIKITTRKPRFSGKSTFKTWIYSIGQNKARDYLRKERSRRTEPLDPEAARLLDEDIEQYVIKNEQNKEFYRGFMQLKPEYRQALWLVYVEGLSVKQAAKIMKRSEGSVSGLISRGKYAISLLITEKGENKDERP